MKILYGVQATGNGHISRARAIGKYLQRSGATVDYLFSGREADKFFDMQQFGNYQLRKGLTFITEQGKINYLKTASQLSLSGLYKDIRQLDCSPYDLVLTDFEPITAWAACQQNKKSIAIGHQYAFLHNIPQQNRSVISRLLFRYFAPASLSLGLHWHHFDQTILPPIIDLPEAEPEIIRKQVLVYLPFEDQQQVLAMLQPFSDFQFTVYGPGLAARQQQHIRHQPPSLQAFKTDLLHSHYVLSNAGFELISEALQLKKHILVKPVQGQMEQQSNALALQKLNLATTTNTLSPHILQQWLYSEHQFSHIHYPNVAASISQWLTNGATAATVPELRHKLWQQTQFS